MNAQQIAEGIEQMRLKPTDLWAGQSMRNYCHDMTCPHCGKTGTVSAYLTPIGREVFQYGMECSGCYAEWNVQYGNPDTAYGYVFA